MSSAWQGQDAAVTQNASALLDHLNRRPLRAAAPPHRDIVDRAATTILSIWDPHR